MKSPATLTSGIRFSTTAGKGLPSNHADADGATYSGISNPIQSDLEIRQQLVRFMVNAVECQPFHQTHHAALQCGEAGVQTAPESATEMRPIPHGFHAKWLSTLRNHASLTKSSNARIPMKSKIDAKSVLNGPAGGRGVAAGRAIFPSGARCEGGVPASIAATRNGGGRFTRFHA